MAEDHDLLLEEWLGVLAELWTAAGKPLEADRLQVYRQSLGEVPLGLLELAVRREVGDPWDVRLAMENWAFSRRAMVGRK